MRCSFELKIFEAAFTSRFFDDSSEDFLAVGWETSLSEEVPIDSVECLRLRRTLLLGPFYCDFFD